MSETREIIDSVEKLEAGLGRLRAAQRLFATYTQEKVDKIFFTAAVAANKMRIPLAKMAVEETKRGIYEDKITKNMFATEYVYHSIKYEKTVGIVEENELEETEAAITGEDIVEYALQFVGNRYVYGGSSLTNGADCSGFVMAVYAAFGVSLPHSSSALRSVGYGVDASDVQPGDIICYSGHVAIYMGGNKIVHASNKRDGIKISNNASYKSIITIRRIKFKNFC